MADLSEAIDPAGLTLKKWQRVSMLIGSTYRKIDAWLTSTEWALLAKDVAAEATAQGIITPLTHANFGQECRLGDSLVLRNSGTEDQGVVNTMNWITFGDQFPQFDWKRRTWQTGNTFSKDDLTKLPDKPLD